MATWSIEAIRETGVPAVLGKLAPRLFGAMIRLREREVGLGRRLGDLFGLAAADDLRRTRADLERLEGKLRRLERRLEQAEAGRP